MKNEKSKIQADPDIQRVLTLLEWERDLGLALSKTSSQKVTLELCLETAIKISAMDCGGIYLVDERNGSIDLEMQKGLPDSFLKKVAHYSGDSPHAQVIGKGAPLYTQQKEVSVILEEVRNHEILKAGAMVPVLHDDKVIACLNLASHTLAEVPQESRTMLELLVTHISGAIARTKTEKALRESEENLLITLNSIGDAVIATDAQGNIVRMNPVAEVLTGWTDDDARGMPLTNVFNIMNAKTREPAINPVKMVMESGQIVGMANHTMLIAKDGREYHIADSGSPIRDLDNNITGVVLVFRNVTDEYQMQEVLKASEKTFRSIIESSPQGIHMYTLEDEDRLVFTGANPAADKLLGIDNSQFIGKTIEEAFPSLTKTEIPDRYRKAAAYAESWSTEQISYEHNKISGAFEVVAFQMSPGKMVAMFNDITKRIKDEEKIKAALHEKDILLKEVHHRVKNNMQVIISLFNLQMHATSSAEIKTVLNESKNRIKAMALVHEKLYQADDLAHINFKEYIDGVVQGIAYSLGIDKVITLKLVSEDCLITIENAIPCGLIINELVSNAYKYAFSPGSTGEIVVSIHKDASEYKLMVKDNGKGIPQSITPATADTLGLKLVYMLAQDQLEGTVVLEREAGTTFTIIFSERDS